MSFSTSMHWFRWEEGPVKDQGEHTCLAGHGKLEVYQYDIVSCQDWKKPNIKNKLGRKKKKIAWWLFNTMELYCSTKSLISQKCSFFLCGKVKLAIIRIIWCFFSCNDCIKLSLSLWSFWPEVLLCWVSWRTSHHKRSKMTYQSMLDGTIWFAVTALRVHCWSCCCLVAESCLTVL